MGGNNAGHPNPWRCFWRCPWPTAGIAATLLAASPDAQAQGNYPNRPIHIIVPYPAGGIVDIVARAVTEQVGRDWKQPIVVEVKARRQQQHRHRDGRKKRA